MSQPERLPAFLPIDENGVDPTAAPEGYRAVHQPRMSCTGCAFFQGRCDLHGRCDLQDHFPTLDGFCCMAWRRADGKYVILSKHEPPSQTPSFPR